MEHECKELDYCICPCMADEPEEQCPIHGGGRMWPPRCIECGKFMPWSLEVEDES